MPFKVIYEDSDTRIHEGDESSFFKDEERFDTLREAQDAAIEYLESLIEDSQEALERHRKLRDDPVNGNG